MEENNFWVAVWRTVGATLVAIVAVIGGCSLYKTSAIKEMVLNGANPIDAACSVGAQNSTGMTVTCALRSMRQ